MNDGDRQVRFLIAVFWCTFCIVLLAWLWRTVTG
jgi:hypothetical protein